LPITCVSDSGMFQAAGADTLNPRTPNVSAVHGRSRSLVCWPKTEKPAAQCSYLWDWKASYKCILMDWCMQECYWVAKRLRLVHTNKHLVEKYTNRPPVTFATIQSSTALRFENFRWYIVWRADSRVWSHHPILESTHIIKEVFSYTKTDNWYSFSEEFDFKTACYSKPNMLIVIIHYYHQFFNT